MTHGLDPLVHAGSSPVGCIQHVEPHLAHTECNICTRPASHSGSEAGPDLAVLKPVCRTR